jgi:putative oxidoreductase
LRGFIFAAHGAQKLFGWWSGPGLEGWHGAMERMNMRPAWLWTYASAGNELIAGLLLAFGLLTPLAAAALIAQSMAIIAFVHWPKGFFNVKGGFEFPLVLARAAVGIAIAGAGRYSVDAVLGIMYSADLDVALVVLGILAGLVAMAVPHLPTLGGRRRAAVGR